MKFGKQKMFLFVQVPGIIAVFFYWLFWMVAGDITDGKIPEEFLSFSNGKIPAVVPVEYSVNQIKYEQIFPATDLPLQNETVQLRYLSFYPKWAKINTFNGLWLMPIVFYCFWLFVTAILLLTHNTVFSRFTQFEYRKRYPWIYMHEYFPAGKNDDPNKFYFKFYKKRKTKKGGAQDVNEIN